MAEVEGFGREDKSTLDGGTGSRVKNNRRKLPLDIRVR